jgi:hypothetical protein
MIVRHPCKRAHFITRPHDQPPPRRPSKKDSPAKLASRIKRRWRIVLMRKTVLGTVEAADAQAAEKVAAIQFELDEQQQRRLLVQELA